MKSLNEVNLIGNLTAQPELKQTPSGTKVASFSVATNRSWKDDKGEKVEQVEFHNIVAWAFLAEILEKYAVKGGKIFVKGRLQTRSWEDQGGNKKYRTEIVAEDIMLLNGPKGEVSASAPKEYDGEEAEYIAENEKKTRKLDQDEIKVEDIPF